MGDLERIVQAATASERSPAVVIEVGWVNGLGAIRSLGRAGVPVIAVDHRPWALGFRSRYAKRFLDPDPLEDEAGFVEALVELGDAVGQPMPLFPTHDEHLNALARNLEHLGDRFRYPFPSWSVIEPLQSKRRQLEAAEAIGLSVPQTLHPRSAAEARAAAEEMGYPVLVKPSDNVVFKRIYRRQAFFCSDGAELDRAYGLAEPYEPMVQEFIPGGDDCLWTFGTYIAADGEVLAQFSGRKLRQTRRNMGSARIGEAVWDDEVVDAGVAILRELAFYGIAQVEWKRDPRDGRLKLIEVNPRLWQWHELSALSGANIATTAYEDLLGLRPRAVRSNGDGRRWAITLMSERGFAFTRLPYRDPVFSVSDPLPGVVHTVRFVVNPLLRR
jgi:D-aspartate ligase